MEDDKRVFLAISRYAGERIWINSEVSVEVRRVRGGRVTLIFGAPRDVKIIREEILGSPEPEKAE